LWRPLKQINKKKSSNLLARFFFTNLLEAQVFVFYALAQQPSNLEVLDAITESSLHSQGSPSLLSIWGQQIGTN